VDIFDVLNSAAALGYNQVFVPGGPWLTPTSVLSARFAKISAQFDFRYGKTVSRGSGSQALDRMPGEIERDSIHAYQACRWFDLGRDNGSARCARR
jgi:hypothetical protein